MTLPIADLNRAPCGQGYRGQAWDFAILSKLRSIALIHAILLTVFFRDVGW